MIAMIAMMMKVCRLVTRKVSDVYCPRKFHANMNVIVDSSSDDDEEENDEEVEEGAESEAEDDGT
jgi:hypothetical protein